MAKNRTTDPEMGLLTKSILTENVQKWTRVFSTRTGRKKKENSVSTFGGFRLWTSFEFSSVLVNTEIYN